MNKKIGYISSRDATYHHRSDFGADLVLWGTALGICIYVFGYLITNRGPKS